MRRSGSSSSSMSCAAATALPSSTSFVTSARRSGRSQTRPCVRPVSAPSGFVGRVEDDLAPLRAAGVFDRAASACRRACTRRRGARSPPRGAGCGSNGPKRRVALHVPVHVPRLDDVPGRETSCRGSRARRARRSPPRCRCRSARRRRRRRRTRARSRRRLRTCASPSSRRSRSRRAAARPRRSSRGRGRRARRRRRCRSPSRVDRVDVLLREVVRPDLDVVELRQARREERADGAAADDADPHDVAPPDMSGV